jgi:RNA polymerase primary sigma factor
LTREQEVHLFRKLNFLKYRASQLRERVGDLDQIQELLQEVGAIQDRIVRSYLGLVVSIVKSWIRPDDDFSELVSVGNLAMVRALERFDFARGRRFSTYATWAVTNDFARRVPRERKRRHRFVTGREGLLHIAVDHRDSYCDAEDHDQYRKVAQMMRRRLTDREQLILNRRFGLSGEMQTLEQLGKSLGISKERVRQIELRALGKLRRLVTIQNLGPSDKLGERWLPVCPRSR